MNESGKRKWSEIEGGETKACGYVLIGIYQLGYYSAARVGMVYYSQLRQLFWDIFTT